MIPKYLILVLTVLMTRIKDSSEQRTAQVQSACHRLNSKTVHDSLSRKHPNIRDLTPRRTVMVFLRANGFQRNIFIFQCTFFFFVEIEVKYIPITWLIVLRSSLVDSNNYVMILLAFVCTNRTPNVFYLYCDNKQQKYYKCIGI